MDAIEQWFSGSLDYTQGVSIYSSLPNSDPRKLKTLLRGRSDRNMTILVSELRKSMSSVPIPKKTQSIVPKSPNPAQEEISIEMDRNQLAQESSKKEFEGIRMGDLPEELRPKFSRARQLFYEMIELKFALNDLDDAEEERALELILEIENRDEERDLLWNVLNHWKTNRRILPDPKDELDGKSPSELYMKKRNLTSSITKIGQRIVEKEKALEKETNGHKRLLLQSSISRSEDTIHKHRVLINRINRKL